MPLHEKCFTYRFSDDIFVEKVYISDLSENDIIVTPVLNDKNELIKSFHKSKITSIIKHKVDFVYPFYALPGGCLITKNHPVLERCHYDENHNRYYFMNGYQIKKPEDIYNCIKKKSSFIYDFILDNNRFMKVNDSIVFAHTSSKF